MNLNKLIQKIINIEVDKNYDIISKDCELINKIFLKSFYTKSKISLFGIIFLLCFYNKINLFGSFALAFSFSLLLYIFSMMLISIIQAATQEKSKINKFVLNKKIKLIKLDLTTEELNIINEHTMSISSFCFIEEHNSLLNYLINKNISSIDHNNLEEFLNILNENNLIQKYLPILVNKIEKYEDLIKIIYPLESQDLTINTTKEILIMSKFLNENPTLKKCIIDTLYENIFLENIKGNSNFLNQLSSEQVVNKILEQYTLKELIHSLFHNSSFNNPYFKSEISNIINLLNQQNKDLLSKSLIEKVLTQKIFTTLNTLEFCNSDFLQLAENLNIENKQQLYLLKSKFSEEILVCNKELKIIHI